MTTKAFSHERTDQKEEWLTPPELIKACGEFDLDPCFSEPRPWNTAKQHYTKEQDGLSQAWVGKVWCNPPYGNETNKWLKRMAHHNNGIALIFARTETQQFFDYIWYNASAVLFIKGRIKFYDVNGKQADSAGAPSVLVAYGEQCAQDLANSGIKGRFISLK